MVATVGEKLVVNGVEVTPPISIDTNDNLWDAFEAEIEKAQIAMACAEQHSVNAGDQMKRSREALSEARRLQRLIQRRGAA